MGFAAAHANCLTEMRQDDDVDTDEEVYDTAIKACSRDFNETRDMLDRYPPKQFLNNYDLKKRV